MADSPPESSLGSSPPDYTSETFTSSSARTPIPTAPRLNPRSLPSSVLLHPPPVAPTKPDFVAAALRKPEDYEAVLRALQKHDNEARLQRDFKGLLTFLDGNSGSGSGPRLGHLVKGPGPARSRTQSGGAKEEMEVKEETEDDEPGAVVAVKKKKKKAKSKKKGKKAVVALDADAEAVGKAIEAEEGRAGLLGPSAADETPHPHPDGCGCVSRPTLSDKRSITAPTSSIDTPYLLIQDPKSDITVHLPPNIPAHVHPMTPLPAATAQPAKAVKELVLNPVADGTSPDPPLSPELRTPADEAVSVLPSINVSSPSHQPSSPTPTETDVDDSEDSPKIVGLGSTGLLFRRDAGHRSTASMDDDISASELTQLTSFAPRDEHAESITSGPLTPEPTSMSLPTSPTLLPGSPIPVSQLLSTLPPNRHLSPAPTLPGSPLRNEVLPLPFSPAREDCTTAKAWSLYFSDTDKTRTPLQRSNIQIGGPAPSEKAYQDNLVPIFSADNLLDLFGKWKALRRQIANATRRPIEAPHTEINLGEMGLGLHHMSDDDNFHFFLQGVKPMWEDPMCTKGGKFMFAGRGDAMDSLFFDLVLLLLADSLSVTCPAPPGSGSEVVGITLSRRPTNTRIEIWLGGPTVPDPTWISMVQDAFVLETKGGNPLAQGEKLFSYGSFHGPSTGRGRGGGGGGMEKKGSEVQGGVPMGRTNSGPGPMGRVGPGGPMMGRGGSPQMGMGLGLGIGLGQGMRNVPLGRSMSMGM